jgi:hypothetical protein
VCVLVYVLVLVLVLVLVCVRGTFGLWSALARCRWCLSKRCPHTARGCARSAESRVDAAMRPSCACPSPFAHAATLTEPKH